MVRNNTKIIALLSLTSFLVAAIIFGIFFSIVSNQKEAHIAQSQERAEAQNHKESLQNLMRVLDETKSDRESLFSRFLREEEVIDFLALVETLGKEQDVTLTTNSLDVGSVNTYFESMTLKLDLDGYYQQVVNLIALFEKLPYQIAISDVEMIKNDNQLWTATIVMSVTKFTKNEF